LTTLQGLCLLYSVLCTAGKERQGWVYFGLLVRAYAEYLSTPQNWPEREMPGTEKLQHAVDRTAPFAAEDFPDSCAIQSSCSTISWQKAPEVMPPKCARMPSEHGSSHLPRWIPYPHQAPEATIHAGCYFNSHCDVSLVFRDLNAVLFPSPARAWNSGRVAAVEQHLLALQQWHQQLPACLQVQPKRTPPCILTLQ
jgi:hypothetical protein